MKSKSVIVALILFIAVNTSFAWERLPSGWDFLLTLFLACIWLLLVLLFLWKLGKIIQTVNKDNGISIIIIGSVLVFCFFYPLGMLKSSDFDPDPYLIASREGAANCTTTITLGIDNTFVQRSICFGVERQTGTYNIKNDTIFFKYDVEKEVVGIIEWNEVQKKDDYGYLNYFGNSPNDKPLPMSISYLKK